MPLHHFFRSYFWLLQHSDKLSAFRAPHADPCTPSTSRRHTVLLLFLFFLSMRPCNPFSSLQHCSDMYLLQVPSNVLTQWAAILFTRIFYLVVWSAPPFIPLSFILSLATLYLSFRLSLFMYRSFHPLHCIPLSLPFSLSFTPYLPVSLPQSHSSVTATLRDPITPSSGSGASASSASSPKSHHHSSANDFQMTLALQETHKMNHSTLSSSDC